MIYVAFYYGLAIYIIVAGAFHYQRKTLKEAGDE